MYILLSPSYHWCTYDWRSLTADNAHIYIEIISCIDSTQGYKVFSFCYLLHTKALFSQPRPDYRLLFITNKFHHSSQRYIHHIIQFASGCDHDLARRLHLYLHLFPLLLQLPLADFLGILAARLFFWTVHRISFSDHEGIDRVST